MENSDQGAEGVPKENPENVPQVPEITDGINANESASEKFDINYGEEATTGVEADGASANEGDGEGLSECEYETSPTASVRLGSGQPVRKYAFKLKKCENGNILTIHHTIQEDKLVLRIRMAVCCFSEHCCNLVAIDRRGNIFVFDLINKRYWQLKEIILKASVITPWVQRPNHYLIGTKLGQVLILDLCRSAVCQAISISCQPIKAISVPDHPLQSKHVALVHVGYEAILIDLKKITAKNRLNLNEPEIWLKFASYLPRSEHIFACFTDDAVHVWSSKSLNALRVFHPIKARDRKLSTHGDTAITAEFTLSEDYAKEGRMEFQVDCQEADYANGLITGFCCHENGSLLCLSTVDRYILLISLYTFELQHICRLRDFIIRECVFLPQPSKDIIVCGITTDSGQVVVLNCLKNDNKLRVQSTTAQHLSISSDGKLLAVLNQCGEITIWSVCKLYNLLKSQEECVQLLKAAFKQTKPLAFGASAASRAAAATEQDCLNKDIRKLLNRDRLLGILREFRWFPCKYRNLIWCTLLQLPYNRREFQKLLKLGTVPLVRQRAQHIPLRSETVKRMLVCVWSCLARWCPVFGHSKFLPKLIFPFVKSFPRNAFVAFEVCATLLMNQFQLCFELHPMEPSNYLGMCENLLLFNAPQLCQFYAKLHIDAKHYAWPLLSSAFSEVCLEDQWLCLWDNILAWPPYFPIFIAVAYNILQCEVIVRLPDKPTVLAFFHEQNPVDICMLITKAHSLMEKCPPTLHPKRYMQDFQAIPKNVYPKFLNYPRLWLAKHEDDMAAMQNEQRNIDERIRQLEMEEANLIDRLQNGLRNEEHTKQIKQMEKLYRDSLKREEERLACQRKTLMLYQKEIRSRNAELAAQVREADQRQRALQMEKDLEMLMQNIETERTRSDTDLLLAEDEMRNQDLDSCVQKCLIPLPACSLPTKYYGDIQKLCNERRLMQDQLKKVSHLRKCDQSTKCSSNSSQLDTIEQKIEEIQKEFNEILKCK